MADELTARDAKLIQYLNEAYGKEKELETSLQVHIAMTTRAPYKKRLQEHLRETKRHAKDVERRIKKLGGEADNSAAAGAVGDAASAVATVANKAVAAAKGPLHMIRGTGEQEKMLKNAKTEYFNEHEEIATYRSIESLAKAVGDSETAKLAKGILREEERMAKFIGKLIPQLTKSVAQEEIPAAERRSSTARRKTSSSRSRSSSSASGATRKRSTSKASGSASGSRSTAKKSTARKASKSSSARSSSRKSSGGSKSS